LQVKRLLISNAARCTVWLSFLLLLALAYPQNPAKPFTISITSPSDTFQVGRAVPIDVTLTNTLDRDIGVAQSSPDQTYRVKVIAQDGSSVTPTRRGAELNDPFAIDQIFSNIIRPLKPGEMLSERLNVTDLYDLSVPGRYMIQFMRPIPSKLYSKDDVGKGSVDSNKLEVTITKSQVN